MPTIKDHLGSVRLVVDAATGAVAQELAYDAWGRVLVDTNPGFQPFGFAGGLYDPETGLVRFGARDYDAEIGRWTAKDPLRFSDSPNLFAYVMANPTRGSDPTGLTVTKCCGGTQTLDLLGAANPNHCWLCTDEVCAGLSGSFFDTEVEEHPGSYTSYYYPDAECVEVERADEACVTEALSSDIGEHFGPFTPFNNCVEYVDDVIDACHPPDLQPLPYFW